MQQLIMKKITTILLLFISTILFGQLQQPVIPLLNVTGSARVSVKPDLGILNILVSELKPKMTDAIKALGEKSNHYNELLNKLGFNEKDIKTTSFAVSKNRFYRDNKYIDSGFVASQTIRLEFVYNQQLLQKIISEFSKSEKPIDFSFGFELSEELKQKVHSQIIEIAVNDANEKASIMVKAAKLKLVSIKTISYGSMGNNGGMELLDRSRKYTSAMASNDEMPSFNFTPNDLIFNGTVSIEWIIEMKK